MANTWYPKFKEALLTGAANSNPSSGAVKAALVSASYAYSATHQFLSDITGQVGPASAALAGKTFTNGAFNATSPTTFTSVSGAQATALVVYIDTGTASTSRLMLFIDTATGLPFTPNTGNLDVTWPTPVAQL